MIAYTYLADVDAVLNVYAEIETIDSINPKFTSAIIVFTIKISNPSPREIDDLSSTFEVFIEENYIGKGSFSKTTIKPESNVYHKTNLTVYYSGLADASIDIIKNWVNEKESRLIIKGNMTAKTLFGLIETSQSFNASS
jgi:LEA14-like dessication related protein